MTGVAQSIPRGVDLTTSGTTTDDYVAVLTWEVTGFGKKHIWLKNTHATRGLTYKVLVYLSNASSGALEKEFVGGTALTATSTDEFVLERAYSKVIVYVKSTVGSTPATYQIDYTGGQT